MEVTMSYPKNECHRSEVEHLYEPCDGKCDGCTYCFADEQTAEEQVVKHELF